MSIFGAMNSLVRHAATPDRPYRWTARCTLCDWTIIRCWRSGLPSDCRDRLTDEYNWPAIEARTYWRHDAPGVVRLEP